MEPKRIIINGEESKYLIFPDGNVYSEKSNKFLTKFVDRHGYVRVKLTFNGRKDNRLVSLHRLVAEYFIPNPDNKSEVNHIDGNKENNNVTNLEWVTREENQRHAIRTGLKTFKCGEDHAISNYSNEVIENVCKDLSSGKYTINEISTNWNVSKNVIYHILNHNGWHHISHNYDIHNYKRERDLYDSNNYEIAFKLMENNELSTYDISDLSGLSMNMIRRIRRFAICDEFKYLYDKYDISKYNPYNKKYTKKITDDIKNECINLHLSGMKHKYIKKIISEKFDINEEFVKLFVLDNM